MELSQLPKINQPAKKRVGRGYGSGKGGHTVGRGQKGQKSRSKLSPLFEGTKIRKSLIKRLPFLRGKGKFKSLKSKPLIINLKYLNLLPAESVVDLEILAKYKLIDLEEAKRWGVKILGEGKLEKPLQVKLPTSASAAEKIKKAGGSVELLEPKVKPLKNLNKKTKTNSKNK